MLLINWLAINERRISGELLQLKRKVHGELVVSRYSIKGKCSSLYVHAAEENGENTEYTCREEERASMDMLERRNSKTTNKEMANTNFHMMMTWLHEKPVKSYIGDLFSYRR